MQITGKNEMLRYSKFFLRDAPRVMRTRLVSRSRSKAETRKNECDARA